jgi:hypothetical protein
MLFFFVCGFSVYPALVLGVVRAVHATHHHTDLLIAALAHLALMTSYLATIYGLSGNPRRYAWLYPISGSMLLAIFAFALKMCYSVKLKWRDTHYGAELTRTPSQP